MNLSRKLPIVREDGSFSFVATFLASSEKIPPHGEIANWLKEWVERNNPWIRVWSSGKKETLDFFADFSEPPKLAGIDQNRIRIQFEGQPGFKWWKDWFVIKFCPQLIDDFPEIESLESCNNVD